MLLSIVYGLLIVVFCDGRGLMTPCFGMTDCRHFGAREKLPTSTSQK